MIKKSVYAKNRDVIKDLMPVLINTRLNLIREDINDFFKQDDAKIIHFHLNEISKVIVKMCLVKGIFPIQCASALLSKRINERISIDSAEFIKKNKKMFKKKV